MRVEGAPRGVGHAPASWALCSCTDVLLPPIYTLIPWMIAEINKTTFPPPQPSVPVRSHLGAFSGILLEGDSIMEGFYMNTITLPMKRE